MATAPVTNSSTHVYATTQEEAYCKDTRTFIFIFCAWTCTFRIGFASEDSHCVDGGKKVSSGRHGGRGAPPLGKPEQLDAPGLLQLGSPTSSTYQTQTLHISMHTESKLNRFRVDRTHVHWHVFFFFRAIWNLTPNCDARSPLHLMSRRLTKCHDGDGAAQCFVRPPLFANTSRARSFCATHKLPK